MIYHWCPDGDWSSAVDTYLPASYSADGFVHCSFRDQVERTAVAVDRGRQGLVILCIDETGLRVVVEDCYEIGEPYPHVYGPIPVPSVVQALVFPCDADGTFRMPDGAP